MAASKIKVADMSFEDRQALLAEIKAADEADRAERVQAVISKVSETLEDAKRQGVEIHELAGLFRSYGFQQTDAPVRGKGEKAAKSGGLDPKVTEYLGKFIKGTTISNGSDKPFKIGDRGRKPIWLIEAVLEGKTDQLDVDDSGLVEKSEK